MDEKVKADFDIESAIKELERLRNENFELKQKNSGLRNYINFRSLGEEFDEWSQNEEARSCVKKLKMN